jgi:hypothetical protein
MADEFSNYAANTFVKALEFIGLVITYVGWYLCEQRVKNQQKTIKKVD